MTRSEKRRNKKLQLILKVLTAGGNVVSACSVVGIARSTFYEWRERCEWFDDEIMRLQCEVTMKGLVELQSQAYGRYVDEVTVRESDLGTVTTRRHRWVNGRLASLKVIMENASDWGCPVDADDEAERVAAVAAADRVPVTPSDSVATVSDAEAQSGADKVVAVGGVEAAVESAVAVEDAVDSGASDGAGAGGSAGAEVSDSEAKVLVARVAKEIDRNAAIRTRDARKAKRKAAKASRRKNR